MSKTWYGHHIETIKGDDYVLFKDYLELDKTIEEKDKEIQRLKEHWVNLIGENLLMNEIQKLEDRIDKAIEYINYYGTTPDQNDDITCRSILKSLLNILQGSEEE